MSLQTKPSSSFLTVNADVFIVVVNITVSHIDVPGVIRVVRVGTGRPVVVSLDGLASSLSLSSAAGPVPVRRPALV